MISLIPVIKIFLFRIVTLKTETWSIFINPFHMKIAKETLINCICKMHRRMYYLQSKLHIASHFVFHNFRQIINFPYLHEILANNWISKITLPFFISILFDIDKNYYVIRISINRIVNSPLKIYYHFRKESYEYINV